MSKSTAIAHMKGGIVQNRTAISVFFRSLKDGRHELQAISADQRSNPQNRYLHGVLIPEFRRALNSVGYNEVKTDEQAKLIMKSMFLTREMPNEAGGKPVHFVQDTHLLTKEELNILIEEVIQFCATEMSYVIPYPNEQTMLSYE